MELLALLPPADISPMPVWSKKAGFDAGDYGESDRKPCLGGTMCFFILSIR